MSKYIFRKEKDLKNKHDMDTVTVECESLYLPDILESFSNFLRASGFVIDGELDIVTNGDHATEGEE